MVRSFHGKETERVFTRLLSRQFEPIARIAKRKLDHLNAAATLSDLAAIPGNQFEALKGDRAGQYSIRINRQFRICFSWRDGDAFDVEIVDYH